MANKYTKKSIERYLASNGALNADNTLAQPKQLSQQEIDEVNRRRKQGTGSLPVLKYSSQNDKVVPNTQEKEIVKGGLSSTLDSVAKIPTRRIPTLSPVSQYASASNASNDVPDTKYTGSVPVLKNQKADNSLLVNDTKNVEEVKSVMSKWASDGYVMSKNEKKQAKELLKNYGYYDTQKSNANVSNMLLNKLKEQYGEEFVNNMNTVANRRNAGAGFVAGVTDSVLTLPEFALNKAGVISDDTYKDIKSESATIKANNPVTSLAGSLLGNVATYGAVNKALEGTGLAEKIGASATKTLNKVPFVGEAGAKAVGQSIGNFAVGEMADIALDTAPTIATNEALGKYRGENGKNDVGAMAKDIGVNLGVNALFNGVAEVPSLIGNYRRINSDLDNLAYQYERLVAENTDDIPVLKDNSIPKVNNAPIDTNTIADGTKDAVDSGKPLSDYFSISDQQKAIADEIDNLKAKVESGTSTDADWESALRMIDDNKAQIKEAVGDGTTRVLDKEATNTALREAKAPWYSVKNASGMRKNKSSVYVDADTLSKMGIKGKKGIENAEKWLGFKITKNPSGDKIISSKQFLDALPDDIKASLNLTGDVASDMQKVAKHQSRLYKDYFGKNPKGAIYSDGENVSNLLDDYMKSVDEQLDSLGKTEQRLKNSVPVVDNTKYHVMAEDTGLNNRVPQLERPEDAILNRNTLETGGENISRVRSNTLQNSGIDTEEELSKYYDPDMFKYSVKTEQESMTEAFERLQDFEKCEKKYLDHRQGTRAGSAVDCDTMMGMHKQYVEQRRIALANGDTALAEDITRKDSILVKNIRKMATNEGQFIQAFAKYTRTPEGALLKADQIADKTLKNVIDRSPKLGKELDALADDVKSEVDALWEELSGAGKSTVDVPTGTMADIENGINNAMNEAELKAQVEEIIRNAVNAKNNKVISRNMTDDVISRLADNIIRDTKQGSDMTDALEMIKMSGATGYTGISAETANQIEEIFAECEKYGYNSLDRIKLENKAYSMLANELNIHGTFEDKFNQWRYFAMLANPKTHIRNIIGNLTFGQVTNLKDDVAAGLEELVDRTNKLMGGEGIERTKSVIDKTGLVSKSDKELHRASLNNANEVYRELFDGNKYFSVADSIDKNKEVFKSEALNKVTNANTNLLNKEDEIGLIRKYGDSLARYLKANGKDAEIFKSTLPDDIALLRKAQAYAIDEAKKATFHQSSKFAEWLSNASQTAKNSGGGMKVAHYALESLMPFKKTPINIIKSATAYSPLEISKVLTYDIYKVAKGTMKASEMIDDIAKSTTGTGLLIAGYLLAKAGIMNSNEDKTGEDKLIGKQSYSLNIGDGTYTIDNFAPVATIMLVGAQMANNTEESSMIDNLINSLSDIADPVFETTMLSGLTDTLTSARYAEDDSHVAAQMFATGATNLAKQYIPSLLGNVSRSIDNTRRSSYTDKQGVMGTVDRTIKQIENKVPFLSKNLEPSIDAWGREQKNYSVSDDPLKRTLYQNLSAGYYSKTEETNADKYLQGIYANLGEEYKDTIYPNNSQNTMKYNNESIRFTPEQKTTYAKATGQTSYNIVNAMSRNAEFNKLSDEDKANALSTAYSVAKEVGKSTIIGKDYKSDNTAYNVYKEKGVDALIEHLTVKTIANNYGLSMNDKTQRLYESGGAEQIAQYSNIREGMDTNGNGSITKEEAMRRLDALGLSQADKRYWFPLFSNAKNPY